jgi:hypothetical protein
VEIADNLKFHFEAEFGFFPTARLHGVTGIDTLAQPTPRIIAPTALRPRESDIEVFKRVTRLQPHLWRSCIAEAVLKDAKTMKLPNLCAYPLLLICENAIVALPTGSSCLKQRNG